VLEAVITHIEVVPKTVETTLRFRVQLKFTDGQEVPISASGGLFCPSDTFVAPVFEWSDQDRGQLPLRSYTYSDQSRRTTAWLNVGVRLGRRELDHIENVRDRDRKKDVHFSVKLALRLLVPKAVARPIKVEEPDRPSKPGLGASTAPSAPPRVLVEGSAGEILQLETTTVDLPYRFAATDWVHDYAPKLGIGSFAVFEIPDDWVADDKLGDHVKKAMEAAKKARQSLQAGDWEDVCHDLRKVWEILRDDQFVKDTLSKDGYSEEATASLCKALNGFFDLASKFDHALAKDKKTLLPELTARKEDAYLAFGCAMSVLNLIARKAQRTRSRG
jgi:hypothetical protein